MVMPRLLKRPLYLRDVLAWAAAHRERTGRWPTQASGDIPGTIGESWKRVDTALRKGLRGLPVGSSLALLLAEQCGARHQRRQPPLTAQQLLAWADAWHERTGRWPTADSGPLPGTGGDTWSILDQALRAGRRGLPGGSSLAQLLATRRGRRNRKRLPPLTEAQILAWADAHHRRSGRWPSDRSGAVADCPGETWRGPVSRRRAARPAAPRRAA
jgi:hypothetical protein